MLKKHQLGVGLKGADCMEKDHVFGFTSLLRVFDNPMASFPQCCVDVTPELPLHPVLAHAGELLVAGELVEIRSYRGVHS